MFSFRTRRPTYERDRVGAIERFDERDNLFAREDLFRYFDDASEARAGYHETHPEHREYDERTAACPGLGRFGGRHEWAHTVPFGFCRDIASERFVDGEPASHRVELSPEEASQRVKQHALSLGADLIGTGPLNQEWVHSYVGRSFGDADGFEPWGRPVDLSHHPHAIAMGFRMDNDLVHAAPEFPTLVATALAYAVSAWVSVRLAAYIRTLGYSARAHHVYNYRVLAVPVAVDCGLGELSRAGFLLTREFGLGVRLGAVTTDLPLVHDGPVDIGVQSFCERCEICAENCPSGSIPFGAKTEHNGILKWKLNEESCFIYWHAVGTDCSVCMSTCPWTKPRTWLHRVVSLAASVKGPHQSLLVAGAKLFYGKPGPPPRERATGMESLRPTRIGFHMRALAVSLVILAVLGVWAGLGAAGGDTAAGRLAAIGWFTAVGYALWLAWTLLGVAVVWTFGAEGERRASWMSAAFFGGVSAAAAWLLVRASAFPGF